MSDVDEEKPLSATEEVEGAPPKLEMQPLGMDYVRNVAENWHKTAQARAVMGKLPRGLKEMIKEQPDDFILGFVNGIQCTHDIGIKALLEDVHNRLMALQGAQRFKPNAPISEMQLTTPIDCMVITAAGIVEGIGYLACTALVEKKDKEKSR